MPGRYQRVAQRFADACEKLLYLAMDEFALHKGHRYATVVVDPISRQVLWIGPGRSRGTARAFFEQLPAGVAQRTEAVAIDMTTAYELEIKAHCPQAEVVYDLFHVVAKYGREVIDRVRVDQAEQSAIPALQLFAKRLKGYWHGILARDHHPLNTSVVEGNNNTIKVIKRRASGYRDE